jgi:hypothetical protein
MRTKRQEPRKADSAAVAIAQGKCKTASIRSLVPLLMVASGLGTDKGALTKGGAGQSFAVFNRAQIK